MEKHPGEAEKVASCKLAVIAACASIFIGGVEAYQGNQDAAGHGFGLGGLPTVNQVEERRRSRQPGWL